VLNFRFVFEQIYVHLLIALNSTAALYLDLVAHVRSSSGVLITTLSSIFCSSCIAHLFVYRTKGHLDGL